MDHSEHGPDIQHTHHIKHIQIDYKEERLEYIRRRSYAIFNTEWRQHRTESSPNVSIGLYLGVTSLFDFVGLIWGV